MDQLIHPFAGIARLPVPHNMSEARQYFATRARQLLYKGYVWTEVIETLGHTWISYFTDGTKTFGDCVSSTTNEDDRIAVMDHLFDKNCDPLEFHPRINNHLDWIEYHKIEQWYGSQRAERSQVLKMNHIDEGLVIIQRAAQLMDEYSNIDYENPCKAFCLHPLFQNDALKANWPTDIYHIKPWVVAMAFEYRSVANEYLSHRQITQTSDIRLSPIKAVNLMLVGDKVQNYKDFVKYHKGTHPRSAELERYFQNWFERLGVNEGLYKKLIKHIPHV